MWNWWNMQEWVGDMLNQSCVTITLVVSEVNIYMQEKVFSKSTGCLKKEKKKRKGDIWNIQGDKTNFNSTCRNNSKFCVLCLNAFYFPENGISVPEKKKNTLNKILSGFYTLLKFEITWMRVIR